MLSKAIALTSVAALAGQSLAFNHRRHHHEDKRAVEVVFETTFTTVTVTDDCTLTVTPQVPAPTGSSSSTFGQEDIPALSSLFASSAVPTQPAVPASQAPSHAASQAPQSTPSSAVSLTQQTMPADVTTSSTSVPHDQATTEAPSISSAAPTSLPSTTQPATTAAAAPSQVMAQSVGKKGMSYNNPTLVNTFKSQCADCRWAYNWGSQPGGLGGGVNYIPLLWGASPEKTNNWDNDVAAARGNGANTLFSFNEPDMPSQSNMDPKTAAAAYKQWMNKYAGQMTLVAPSISNSGASNQGVSWLQQFITECNQIGCHIDACNTHWYSGPQWADTLFDQISKVSAACGGKPVYVTEFAPTGASDADIVTFMQNVLPRLEADASVAAYAYFMVNDGNLMADDNNLSSYGKVYATA